MTTNDKLGQSIDAKRQLRGKHVFLANKRKDLPPRILREPVSALTPGADETTMAPLQLGGGRDGYLRVTHGKDFSNSILPRL